jgi:predicted ATPase
MVGKLRRLSDTTQTALRQLACLGNEADIATLMVASGHSREDTHASLVEAVRAGLVLRLEDSYAFLHDRIQEAAYALTPERHRAETHLRIGRILLAPLAEADLDENLFDLANQLNRGAELLTEHDEKAIVAGIDLSAGRKAKASAAYASARGYCAAGTALLDEHHWTRQYALTFALWLERAECELFTGDFAAGGRLIEQMLERAASTVDEAAAACLKVQLQVIQSEIGPAVSTALRYLRSFGIDLPAHPTEQQVRSEYEAVLRAFDGRSIESVLDLPLVTDTELQRRVETALRALAGTSQLLDYYYYAALTVSALYETATAGDRQAWRELLREHQEQLREWAESYPPTFGDKHALVSAEIARLEGRDADALRLYEQAILAARQHGFVRNEGLAHELAAQYCLKEGLELVRRALDVAHRTGDLTFSAYGAR